MDIGVIKIFKHNFRRILAERPNQNITRRIPSDIIKRAWNLVPATTISQSFRNMLNVDNRNPDATSDELF